MGRKVLMTSLNDQIITKIPYNLVTTVKIDGFYFFNNFSIEVILFKNQI